MKKNVFLSALVALSMPLVAQQSEIDTTFTATSNPFVKYKYLGDPAALVDGNTLYLYAGHDQCPERQERYVLNDK